MLKRFEQFNDPYGEEIDADNGNFEQGRTLEELLSILDKEGCLEGDELLDEERDMLENNLGGIMYRGVDLSNNCDLFELGDLIVSLWRGDEYGQGWYLAKIDKMRE